MSKRGSNKLWAPEQVLKMQRNHSEIFFSNKERTRGNWQNWNEKDLSNTSRELEDIFETLKSITKDWTSLEYGKAMRALT